MLETQNINKLNFFSFKSRKGYYQHVELGAFRVVGKILIYAIFEEWLLKYISKT